MITAFGDFVGREEFVSSLERMSEEENVPGAVLIEGQRGSGKKTLAKSLAAAILCKSREKRPCGVCSSCKKAVTGHPDILLENGGDKGVLSVDDIRRLRKEASVMPVESSRKVMIITGSMAPPAQNALLKTLEEPPAGVTFIITVRRREEMLDTVVSRCMPVLLTPLAISDVEEFLQRKFSDVPKEEIRRAAERSEGFIGAAEELLFSEKSDCDEALKKMLQSTAKGDAVGFLKAVMPFEKDVASFADVIVTAGGVFRDAYMKKEGAAEEIFGYAAEVDALCGAMTSKRLAECYRSCEKTAARLKENPKMNLLLTVLCAELIR